MLDIHELGRRPGTMRTVHRSVELVEDLGINRQLVARMANASQNLVTPIRNTRFVALDHRHAQLFFHPLLRGEAPATAGADAPAPNHGTAFG